MKGGRRTTTWKPTWKSGATMVIRVPLALAPDLLRIARHLDSGGDVEYIAAPVPLVINHEKNTPKKEGQPRKAKAKRLTKLQRRLQEAEAERREISMGGYAEVVYQRFLDGKLEGMERVGHGRTMSPEAAQSWMSTAIDELLAIHGKGVLS